jgi:hypothetical protein
VPWGLLPVGVPLVVILTLGIGALTLPRQGALERLLAGALLTLTLVVVLVRLTGAVGLLRAPVLLVALGGAAAAVIVVSWRGRAGWRAPWRKAVSLENLPLLVAAAAAVVLAVVAAYYLPVWQWDALGYHLPFVNFALQNGTFADVPTDAQYLSTYPHVVEYAFAAWRALLPDDRLVELAHLPFGLLGGLAVAAVARQQGARADHAVAGGAAWLTLPAVFLQLPTNYTDVASAALLITAIAFVLGPVDRRRVLLAGVAIGLFLGSKPSAPIAAVLLLGVLAVRAYRSGFGRVAAVGWLVTGVLGAETYVVNVVRFGNPIWPVRLDVGPVHLPGRYAMSELLGAGAAAPRTHGNMLERVAESWSTIVSPLPVFDMRIGGLGLAFLCALPIAVIRAIRTRSPAVAVCFIATLLTPDPAVARYVLGFAGLVLALAVPAIGRLGRGARIAVLWAVAAVSAHGLYVAYPGLTGEGPPLTSYVHMTLEQRQRAVGADGPPTAYLDAIARVGPGEITVFDGSMELPYLAWPYDLSRHAMRIPDHADAAAVKRIVDAPNVRMLIVGDDTVAGAVVRGDPRYVPQFACRSAPCAVYLRNAQP